MPKPKKITPPEELLIKIKLEKFHFVQDGLTWDDTEFESNAVRYGYNLAVDDLNKLIKSHAPKQD